MKVVVSPQAYAALEDFYTVAIDTHPTLDEETVLRKIERLENALQRLGYFPYSCPKVRYRKKWIEEGCRDFVFEDLHAAYKIVKDKHETKYVFVVDVCHSKLYHD